MIRFITENNHPASEWQTSILNKLKAYNRAKCRWLREHPVSENVNFYVFDEDTLVLVTGDHPSYSNTPTNKLFKPYQKEYDNLPFIIITRTPLDKPLTDNPLVSQLDIAPTIMDLLNLPQPKAFFGHSLFDQTARRSVFDIKEDYAVVTTDTETKVLPLNSKDPQEKALIELMTSFPADN